MVETIKTITKVEKTTRYNVGGEIIIHTMNNGWNKVESQSDKSAIKSFGVAIRPNGEIIEANKGLDLIKCLKIVSAKAKEEYNGTIPDYEIIKLD